MDIELLEELKKLMRVFYRSKIIIVSNHFEIILDEKTNLCFRLNIENVLELKCKVLEWVSCFIKMQPYFNTIVHKYGWHGYTEYEDLIEDRHNIYNDIWQNKILKYINNYFEKDFTIEDMMKIYQRIGNGINRDLTIKFIESDFDFDLL